MKAILVIDMPENCDGCEVKCDGYTAKQYAEKGITKPSWCPLKPMPQKKKLDEDLFLSKNFELECVRFDGYNKCIDEILGEQE